MKGLVEVQKDIVVRQFVQGSAAEIGFGHKEFYSEIHIAPEQLAALKKWISDHGRVGLKDLGPQEYLEVIMAETCMAKVMDELDEAGISYQYLYANSSGEVALRPGRQ